MFMKIEQTLRPSQIKDKILDVNKEVQIFFEKSSKSQKIPIFFDDEKIAKLINLGGWNCHPPTPMLSGLTEWYRKNSAKAGDIVIIEKLNGYIHLSIRKTEHFQESLLLKRNSIVLSSQHGNSTDCRHLSALFKKLNSFVNLNDYSDEKWCNRNYSFDEYFLYILCWAAWFPERQEAVWKQVRKSFTDIGKRLNEYSPGDIKRLTDRYPLPWEKKWAERLIDYLLKHSLTTENLIDKLKNEGYESAKRELQGIVGTTEEKIVSCWLRDIARLDAFPIDTRIRDLLHTYDIPVSSDFIIEYCKQNSVPVRNIARALYDNAESLVNKKLL